MVRGAVVLIAALALSRAARGEQHIVVRSFKNRR
jgi:hypothetical protein